MSSTISSPRFLGLALFSLVASSIAAQGVMTTQGQVVAKTGDAPTGLPAGVTLGTSSGTGVFDTPVMSANGTILVRSRLVGTGVTTLNERALLFGHANGDMKVLLRAGDLDPSGTFPNSQVLQTSSGSGLPLGSNTFGTQRISPFGDFLMFQAQLYDPTLLDGLTNTGANANNQVIYWGVPGALQILARRATTTMPDGAVMIPDSFAHQATSLNSTGQAVFKTTLSTTLGLPSPAVTTLNDTAWVTGAPGSLTYVIRESDLVLGGTCGIKTLGNNCVLNAAGQILHDETLSTTLGSSPATTANDSILFIQTAGVDSVLAREGDVAVDSLGAPLPGVFYGGLTLTQGFTTAGRTGFHSTLTGAVTTATDGALFVGDTTQVQMVLREGDVAPGTGGETIAGINSSTRFSEAGLVAGMTLVSPGIGVTALNDSILLLCKAGSPPVKIAREGDPAPGMPGFVFGDLTGGTNFGSSSVGSINNRGFIVIPSMRVNNGVVALATTYSWDPVLGLQPQLVQGDIIGGLTTDFITGSPLYFPSSDDNPLGFTQDGDFVGTPQTTAANFVARGHVGTMGASPSSIPVGGGTQTFFINASPTYGFQFYIVLATSLGTRPGFPSPLGPQTIPLNFDPLWTQLSLDLANSVVWGNSLGITDANGVPFGAAPTFTMPPGYPGFLGTTLHHAALFFDFSLVSTFVTEPSALKLY